MSQNVISADGTTIAYDQVGTGPALILVGGSFEQRAMDSETAQLAAFPLLAEHFTVYHYDRRGRGDSTDTQPYSVQREVEDIEALIDVAGGTAFVSGISSGAILAMEAAIALGNKVKKLAMYEPPFSDDPAIAQALRQFHQDFPIALAEGRRGDAVDCFFLMMGMPAEYLAGMRHIPFWGMWEDIAPTLGYDAALLGETGTAPLDRAATITIPTLVMDGAESPYPSMNPTALALAKAIPNAKHRTLAGQTHEVTAGALAPVLVEFFSA
jgi:pimeloyl-ACP methyl ester carboxylesterase